MNSSKYAFSQADCAVQQEIHVSTKDISRSALEGGRANYNKYERNESHRHERSRAKVWLDSVRYDDEAADDSDPAPRNPVSKGFTDKLNPCYRWLASRSGQPWAKVYSELTEKFDTRNLASWHIVNQHMLSDVQGAGTARDSIAIAAYHRFYIDDGGILRDRGKYRWRNQKPEHKGPSKESVLAYAKGRKVIDNLYSDTGKWWAMPDAPRWDACVPRHCKIAKHLHRVVETTQQGLIDRYTMPGLRSLGEGDWWRTYATQHLVSETWRPHKKFSKVELKWWDTVSWEIRHLLLVNR